MTLFDILLIRDVVVFLNLNGSRTKSTDKVSFMG